VRARVETLSGVDNQWFGLAWIVDKKIGQA
jgi:hypothetical protein